jgi:maltooligosyltrehalose trehalohydrolase
MSKMRVWAPDARSMEIVVNGQTFSMNKAEHGWWLIEEPVMNHGADYSFLINGEGPYPDPRSSWQPEGIYGVSRMLDQSHFLWTDEGWQPPPLSSAVIYELHIGTFTPEGTFDSAVNRLDHLLDLGITHVELMPVAEFSGNWGWGYDGVDLYAPHHAYGGPEGLKRLVNACHLRGLAVLLDVVYNHLGPSGNYLNQFGPYFTDRYATPWGQAVNFDEAYSNEVRQFFIDNALMWLRDYHFDGLRLDAVHAIVDISAIHFLEQLATEVRNLEAELGRHFVLIAENDLNNPRVVRPPQIGGFGLDAQWNEDFHHALHALLTGEDSGYYNDFGEIADLAKVLTRGFVYDGCYSHYRKRIHGRSAAGLSGHQFVGFLQNHDQVGNRAIGERTGHLLTEGQLKIGAALVITSPFIPMLFQGEEWAASSPFMYFANHQEQELAESVRNGRRKEFTSFGWDPERIPDPQKESTYFNSKLKWSEAAQRQHHNIFNWYQSLIKLRRRLPALTDARLEETSVVFDEKTRWLIMRRGSVLVICNFADKNQRIPFSGLNAKEVVLASQDGIINEGAAILMPKHTAAILTDRE